MEYDYFFCFFHLYVGGSESKNKSPEKLGSAYGQNGKIKKKLYKHSTDWDVRENEIK